MRRLEGTNYAARKAVMADPKQKEIRAAKVLEDNGHTVYFTPENKTRYMKNYDAIIDGRLGEFKAPKKFTQIKNRLDDADGQKASIVCIEPSTKNHTINDAIKEIKDWFKNSQHPINYVDTVLLIWEKQVTTIKK